MAEKTNLSSEIIPGTSTNMGAADNNIFTITSHKLNGQNYLQWSQFVMMFICGRGNYKPTKGSKSPNVEIQEQHGNIMAY